MEANPRKAIALYAVGARDVCDFIDMVREESSVDTLKLLYEMLITKSKDPGHDQELNDILAPLVKRQLEYRGY